MKILQGEQLSAAWFQAHAGVVSGSHMASVLQFTKKGPGAKRKTYLASKVAELLTGHVIEKNYVSQEMLDGIEREPAGRLAYEMEEDALVKEVGFALHDSVPRFGGSVDGLVDDDGQIELKCPKASTHAAWIRAGCIPPDHLPQIQAYLAITGRAWCDFVSYCPMMPRELRLMTIRLEASPVVTARILDAVAGFNGEVDAWIDDLHSIAGPFKLPAAQQAVVDRGAGDFTEAEDRQTMLTDEDFEWAKEQGIF